jgi:hypothetical protein
MLTSGMHRSHLLLVGASVALGQVKITQAPDRIAVQINGQPCTTLFFGPDTVKPYLHPLRSASGKIVTRRYPMEEVAGESRDHVHHRGLWFGHGDVNGYDFWVNEASEEGAKKGRIVLAKVVSLTSGIKDGGFAAIFNWLDTEGRTLLHESRTMVFYASPADRTIDVGIGLEAVGKTTFGDTKEGTFAIRVARELEAPAGTIVNAQGARGEAGVWGKRSEWVDYSGQIGGEKLGIAILDHPSNPRHPAYWHARSYGLFAVNIFGLREFLHDKTKDGSLTIPPGGHLKFRYRVIVHSGDAAAANIAARYAEYAAAH